MKSLVCKLDGTSQTAVAAYCEAETFAVHSNLNEKQALHLRLLTEELLGMASGLLELQDGKFWIESEGKKFRLYLTARAAVGDQARQRLLDASSSGENTLCRGVTGKIMQALDLLLTAPAGGEVIPMGMHGGAYAGMIPSAAVTEWSLERYRQSVKQEDKAAAWDELEKSVLGKLADDIRVGARANRVEIIIDKAF